MGLGVMNLTDTSYNLSGGGGWRGFRFQSIAIAKGTPIVSAFLSPHFDNALNPMGANSNGTCTI